MSNPVRKPEANIGSSGLGVGAHVFPDEAYLYEDDVTAEAVEKLRQSVASIIGAEEWDVVDGFRAFEFA